ncbi:3'-5' exonuclease [Rhodoplanes sp. TEM]|uniref:3'-5' exonuclease n=1 Tax=Rhodoplanes tepidamans TaxID=200616 RepID=A0ABT5JA88_RHOTP|nr:MULTISPECIES: 3'-5' exonuclease [Rhodoplanes]MDC7786363.1 3'-5' exonuclease [Rhodoplanes tepidamans]MDC7985435.1 3'-5' exonuclease [Rhodoplanes sp. TEM]MDQ0354107.1 DNA polymerase-3 subunit epsilon [Rhodoplanes tepidamans]
MRSELLRRSRALFDRILLADNAYAFLFDQDDSGEVVSFDCETSGFNILADDVISIAAIKIRGNTILTSETFRALVRPGAAMEVSAIKVHQLRETDVKQGRTIREVMPEFLRFIGSRPLVGYWVSFDVRMINKYLFGMLNINLPNRQIDVSELYYERKYGKAPPGTEIDLRYAAIAADLGLTMLPQHDAFNDALTAAQMYVILKDMQRRGARIPRQRSTPLTGDFSV